MVVSEPDMHRSSLSMYLHKVKPFFVEIIYVISSKGYQLSRILFNVMISEFKFLHYK